MMRMFQPLDTVHAGSHYIFLAGSMGKKDWQSEFYLKLIGKSPPSGWHVLNPRPVTKPLEVAPYVKWEFNCMISSSIIAFWFPKSDRPDFGLFHLGRWTSYDKPIFVGVEKGFALENEVKTELECSSQEIAICHSLETLVDQVFKKAKEIKS